MAALFFQVAYFALVINTVFLWAVCMSVFQIYEFEIKSRIKSIQHEC